MRSGFSFGVSLFKFFIKGISLSACVLLVIIACCVGIETFLWWFDHLEKCEKIVLTNDQEAIGALKCALMDDREYDDISITHPARKISLAEINQYDLSGGWKISVTLALKGKKTVKEFYITECAEIIDVEE